MPASFSSSSSLALLTLVTATVTALVTDDMPPRLRSEFHDAFFRLDHDGDGVVTRAEAAEGLLSVGEPSSSSARNGRRRRFEPPAQAALQAACAFPQYEPVYFSDCVSAHAHAAAVASPSSTTGNIRFDGASVAQGEEAFASFLGAGPTAAAAAAAAASQAVKFEDALAAYFGECTDMAPPLAVQLQLASTPGQHRRLRQHWQTTRHKGVACADLVHDDFGLAAFGRNACGTLVAAGHCETSCRMCRHSSSSNTGRKARARGAVGQQQLAAGSTERRRSAAAASRRVGGNSTGALTILIASDWHVEPWYCTEGATAAAATDAGAPSATATTVVDDRGDSIESTAAATTKVCARMDFRISRFPGANMQNIFTCRNGSAAAAGGAPAGPCLLTGSSDPPLEVVHSGFENFENPSCTNGTATKTSGSSKPSVFSSPLSSSLSAANNLLASLPPTSVAGSMFRRAAASASAAAAAPSILLFPGDTQAHEFTPVSGDSWEPPEAISALMGRALAFMTSFFSPEDVFISPGNNDGPHNAVFVHNGDDASTAAWAKAVVVAGVVTDDAVGPDHRPRTYENGTLTATQFFMQTGYLLKRVDPKDAAGLKQSQLFVLSVNTNLGAANERQMAAFDDDLQWLSSILGQVYIMGHHPDTMRHVVPPKMLSSGVVRGVLAGHVHFARSTDPRTLFTQVPAMTEAAWTTGYFHTTITPANTRLMLSTDRDLITHKPASGKGKLASCDQWTKP